MAETQKGGMSLIASLSAIAGLIIALFAVGALWNKHGWVSRQEHNRTKRELSIHILENRIMIMRLEAHVGVVDNKGKHDEQIGRLQGMLDKLHRRDIRDYFVLE